MTMSRAIPFELEVLHFLLLPVGQTTASKHSDAGPLRPLKFTFGRIQLSSKHYCIALQHVYSLPPFSLTPPTSPPTTFQYGLLPAAIHDAAESGAKRSTRRLSRNVLFWWPILVREDGHSGYTWAVQSAQIFQVSYQVVIPSKGTRVGKSIPLLLPSDTLTLDP
ncbi:hypothetical protein BKA93DRAFT_749657 [Sparassis latifolia]